jgi:hypothetical protein
MHLLILSYIDLRLLSLISKFNLSHKRLFIFFNGCKNSFDLGWYILSQLWWTLIYLIVIIVKLICLFIWSTLIVTQSNWLRIFIYSKNVICAFLWNRDVCSVSLILLMLTITLKNFKLCRVVRVDIGFIEVSCDHKLFWLFLSFRFVFCSCLIRYRLSSTFAWPMN